MSEETSFCFGRTSEGVEDLTIMAGAEGGEIWCGIFCEPVFEASDSTGREYDCVSQHVELILLRGWKSQSNRRLPDALGLSLA